MNNQIDFNEYYELIYRFLDNNEGLIRKMLYNPDDYHTDEIKSSFQLKAFGYKRIKLSKEEIAKLKEEGKDVEEFKLVQGNIPINLKNAIYNQDETRNHNFLKQILRNIIRNYERDNGNKDFVENQEVIEEASKEVIDEILETITPNDHINEDFQELIISNLNNRMKDKYLGFVALYLTEVLSVDAGEIYKLWGIKPYEKKRSMDTTIKTIKKILQEQFPHIDFNDIEKKTKAKQNLIRYIQNNQKHIRSKLYRQPNHVKRKMKEENLNKVKEDLPALLKELGLNEFRIKNLNWYISENYYDFNKVIRAIENIHVWQKDFEEITEFIHNYILEE